jgi:hypothetical protein
MSAIAMMPARRPCLIDYRNTADLFVAHETDRFEYEVVRTDSEDLGRHRISYGRVCVLAVCDRTHNDVAIGDDPDEFAVLDNRDRAHVAIAHHDRSSLQRRVPRRRLNVRRHYFPAPDTCRSRGLGHDYLLSIILLDAA